MKNISLKRKRLLSRKKPEEQKKQRKLELKKSRDKKIEMRLKLIVLRINNSIALLDQKMLNSLVSKAEKKNIIQENQEEVAVEEEAVAVEEEPKDHKGVNK